MRVEIYSDKDKASWNNFVKQAANSHFIFQREFMEYHKDRFDDFSLMVYNSKNTLVALLPANIKDTTLHSHQGLSFGGFIVSKKIKLSVFEEILKAIKEFLKSKDIKKLIYKPIPFIYHSRATFEDIYLLPVKLINKDICSFIDLKESFSYSNGRKHSIRKAKKYGFEIKKSDDLKSFWQILESVLQTHHSAKPVHTLKEIELLAKSFPKNIELFLVKKDKKIYAGALTFVNQNTVKLQYVANHKKGRELGALDLLIDHLLKEVYHDKRYFDFGTSLDSSGNLNPNLLDQKERFGTSSLLQETYEWVLS